MNKLNKKNTNHLHKKPFGFVGEVFARLWAFWALIIFILTLFIAIWPILLSFYVKEPHGIKLFKTSAKIWMTVFLNAIGCPLSIRGKENYDPTTNYVVTCNHSSLMDVPLITPFFPGANKTIAKKSMAKIPVFGWVYTRGSVLVDRTSDGSRRKSYEAMKQVLAQNMCMAIYPEGTRNRTGKPLKDFYDGAFRLAVDCKKAVMPVVMFNTAKALPPGKFFYVWPTPLVMVLLPPVSPIGKTVQDLKAEVYDMMWKKLEAGL